MSRSPIDRIALLTLLAALAIAPNARAGTISWTEQNAGDSPATAEVVFSPGVDDLFQISGNIDPLSDPADVYLIRIVDPAAFSVRTFNGDSEDPDTEFDAVLALFDSSGLGIYANDDRIQDDGNAELPVGDPLAPTQPGLYLVAIYDDNYAALSEFSENGVIFPDTAFPFTDVVGPTGPGGASPLVGFGTLDSGPSDPRAYSLEFTGAAPVPEPATAALLALGLGGLAAVGRRRS